MFWMIQALAPQGALSMAFTLSNLLSFHFPVHNSTPSEGCSVLGGHPSQVGIRCICGPLRRGYCMNSLKGTARTIEGALVVLNIQYEKLLSFTGAPASRVSHSASSRLFSHNQLLRQYMN